MRVKMRGLRAAARGLDKKIAKQVDKAEEVVRGLAAVQLATLIRSSPQWSGDFAANWRLSIGRIDRTFVGGVVPPRPGFDPYQQGDRPAVQWGLAHNVGADTGFKLGQKIYISNSAKHDDNYAQGILDGTLKLRDVNMRVTVQSAMDEFYVKYSGRLSGHQIGHLRRVRAGSRWA